MPVVDVPLREWLFCQQSAQCYLQVAPECREAHGFMSIDPNNANRGKRFATIEHLRPSCAAMNKDKRGRIRLLACRQCNNIKADLDVATEAQLEFAIRIDAVWARICNGLDEREAFKRSKMQWFERDGWLVCAEPLPIDPYMEGKIRTARLHRSYSR